MDPLGLLPYALAAGGGRLDGMDVPRLVAAGVTLLQRSAPLVRAMSGRHAAVAPTAWRDWLVALAASDGRGLLTVPTPPEVSPATAQATMASHDVGAMFLSARGSAAWGEAVATSGGTIVGTAVACTVGLEDAPQRAHVRSADREQTVDLGTHFGLDLMGDTATPGRDEPCLALGNEPWRTHRTVIAAARACMERHAFTPVHRTLNWLPFTDWDGLVAGTLAPLLAGGMVLGHPALDAHAVHAHLAKDAASVVVLSGTQLDALMAVLRAHPLEHDPLARLLVREGASAAQRAAWQELSAAPLVAISL